MKFYYPHQQMDWSTDISSFLNSICQAPGSRLHHLPEEERLAPTSRVRGISWIPGTYVIGIISNVQESKLVL